MEKTYPAVLFMANQGRKFALVVGIAVAVIATLLFAIFGHGWLLVGGFVSAVAAWAGLLLMAELVEVVAETLLPR